MKELFSRTRGKEDPNRRIHQAHVTHAYTLSEIARLLGLHYAAVSKIVKTVGEDKVARQDLTPMVCALEHAGTVIHAAFFRVDEADKVPNMAGYKRRRSHRV